jgi:hypothetical protein
MRASKLTGVVVRDDRRVELCSAPQGRVFVAVGVGGKEGNRAKVQLGSKSKVGILGRQSEGGIQGPYMKYMGLEPSLSLGAGVQGSQGSWTQLMNLGRRRDGEAQRAVGESAKAWAWLTRVRSVMGTEVRCG